MFPTQADANGWARRAAEKLGAVERRRFLGWDRFLGQCRRAEIGQAVRLCEGRHRYAWALRVLERQRRQPFLARLLHPAMENPPSRAPYLAGLAAKFEHLSSLRGAMDPDLWADLALLKDDFDAFLEAKHLKEPSSLKPRHPEGGKILLAFPSLYPAHPLSTAFLAGAPGVEFWEGEPGEAAESGMAAAPARALRFPSQWEEWDWVFSRFRRFLDQGGLPEEAALHVPSLDPETRAYLERFSRRYDIPLGFRTGSPLSRSAFGKFLSCAARSQKEGFAASSLRSFLGSNPAPWKEGWKISALLAFMEKASIPEGSADPKTMRALWRESLETMGRAGAQARDAYISLSRSLDALAGAGSFASLRKALFDFRQEWVSEEPADLDEEARTQRSMVELDALADLEETWGGYPQAVSRLEAFLAALDEASYAPPESEGFLPVFPYHVGPAFPATIRFVLDASQDSTASVSALLSPYPPNLGGEADWTWDDAALFRVFAASGACLCFADAGLKGSRVPHPYLVGLGMGSPSDGGLAVSPEDREAEAWASGDPGLLAPSASRRSLSASRRGLERLNAVRGSGSGRTPSLTPDTGGLYKFNPRGLAAILQCPFKWFLSRKEGAEPRGRSKAYLAEGSFAHALIGALLSRIKETEGRVGRENLGTCMEMLDALVPQVLAAQLAESGPALRNQLSSALPRIRHRIGAVLEFEAEFQGKGWDVGMFELPMAREYPEYGIVLRGRADRVAKNASGGLALIDYKRKNTPKKKDFLAGQDGRVSDFQITSYASILAETEGRPELGMYWSIDLSVPVIVFGPGGGRESWEDFRPERTALERAIEEVGLILSSGKFLAIKPSEEACRDCPGRPICRAHFHSEAP